jgi:hypothetical protein
MQWLKHGPIFGQTPVELCRQMIQNSGHFPIFNPAAA